MDYFVIPDSGPKPAWRIAMSALTRVDEANESFNHNMAQSAV